MYDGFVERSRAVQRLLADSRTSFVIVSTLEAAPLREAEFFASELNARKLDLGATVLNKVLPSYLLDPHGAEVAQLLRSESGASASRLAHESPGFHPDDERLIERVLSEIAGSFLDFRSVAKRETEQREEMSKLTDVLVSVPFFHQEIVDLGGLLRLGDQMWSSQAVVDAVDSDQ